MPPEWQSSLADVCGSQHRAGLLPPSGPAGRRCALRSIRASTFSSINPITVGNQAIIAKKRAILYKNGYTLPGKAAALLAAEAVSGIEHSQKLGRNVRKANPNATRPLETDAHHVVASEASGARVSRVLIFAVGIGNLLVFSSHSFLIGLEGGMHPGPAGGDAAPGAIFGQQQPRLAPQPMGS
jgi:hypothetical protein